LALAGCSVFGIRSGTEEPAYSVAGNAGPVQIRQYAPRLAASVIVPGDEISARNTGFRRLAGYIFGANARNASIPMTAPVVESPAPSAKIAMTAPVAQAQTANGWMITFYMPRKYSLENLPRPTHPGIQIHQVPATLDAVYRFSGIPGIAAVNQARARLVSALSGSAWQITGDPVTWFYDPPWTLPWFRRNEVAVPVAPRHP
jgi:cysteine synthase